MRYGGGVYGSPRPGPGVIAKEAWLPFAFRLDSSGGEHEVLLVSDQVVGQYSPEPVLDELGHLFSNEVSMLGSGGVATTTDALVFLFQGPRLGLGLDWDSIVPPIGQERRRGMV